MTASDGHSDASAEGRSFDTILRELKAVVAQLEDGSIPLEASLEAFERGVRLSRDGQRILDEAERRVEVLMRDGSREPLENDSR